MRVKYPPSRQKQSVFLGLIMLFVLGHFMVSCSKYKDDLDFDKLVLPGWNPEFAVPLVNTTYSLADILGDENIEFVEIDEDGLVSLVYSSKEIFSARAEEFITLPDQGANLTIPLIFSNTGEIDTIPNDYAYIFLGESSDQRIDSIFLKAGQLRISGDTDLNKNKSDLIVTLPEMINRQTGLPLVFEIPLDNPDGQQSLVSFDQVAELSDYTLKINPEGDGINNEINFLSQIIIHPDDNPHLSPYQITVDISFSNMEFQQFFGYLGNYSLEFADSIKIQIFENSLGGGVSFGQDALSFFINITNSIGVPVTFEAEEFFLYSPFSEPNIQDVFLFGQGIENKFEILSPDFNQVGQSVETNLNFSETNFPEVFLSMAPRLMSFDFDATFNVLADTTLSNFIQDTSRISFGTALAFQMYTAIDLLSFQDTLNLNLDTSADEIDYLLFRINTENGFPLSALLQIYFADANYNIVDSLIYDADTRLIRGAEVGLPPKFRVVKPAVSTTDINIDREWLDNVLKAEHMFLRAGLKTTEGNLAKIYSDYELKFQLGIKTGLNISSDN